MDEDSSAAGLALFARYSYAPNERGYCGPDDHRLLLSYLRGAPVDGRLATLVRKFSGPLPYLRSIAEATGASNPFAREVVEAYWIGSPLLQEVDSTRFGLALEQAFSHALTVDGRRIRVTTPGGLPHHSYHVLVTYPWIDHVPSGDLAAVQVLDRCRIRWGQVVDDHGEEVTVRCQPLELVDRKLVLGGAREERVTRQPDPGGGAPLSAGQWVACHWDWLCDELSPDQLHHLSTTSADQLRLVNERLLGPAR